MYDAETPQIIRLGFMDNGTGQHQSNTVYDENGISPSITTIMGGGTQQIKILTREEKGQNGWKTEY